MQTLKFLGRGSAFNTKEYNTSAFLIKNNELILIDCGENIFSKIMKLNILENIKKVHLLITHFHTDHIGSIGTFISYLFYVKKIITNIYTPDKKIIDILNLIGQDKNSYNYISKEDVIINNINIGFIESSHTNLIKSYSIILNFDDKYLFYSGDCNKIDNNVIKYLLNNIITEFYIDTCSIDYDGNVHFYINKLCNLIPIEYRNKVYCMHIDNDNLIQKIKNEKFNIVKTIER